MNVAPVFINFLASDQLRLDNSKIENFALSLKKSSAGRVVSNSGGWQSNNLDLNAPDLRELLEAVDAKLNEVHAHFGFSSKTRQVIAEGWININNRGGYNRTHNHPGSFFSCVYYVKGGPNKGDIAFNTPIEAHAYTIPDALVTSHNAFTGHDLFVPPVTGNLLIFPSWLKHYVKPNETDEDRISIALNSTIINMP
jgi:uncharacterized protein (TIGR02466 family)